MKGKALLFLLLSLLLWGSGCKTSESDWDTEAEFEHEERNGVYYWKTVLNPGPTEFDFLEKHDVGRMYLRMFDVVAADSLAYPGEKAIPNATVIFPEWYENRALTDALKNINVVPVVYVTLEALKAYAGNEDVLAEKIFRRVANMCSFHEISAEGLQLDCDWTKGSAKSFFALCESMREVMDSEEREWELSSTIRLHQLLQSPPPVDYGVLMVYNTGNFKDPDARNSILDASDVRPYLKHLEDYPLHLDVAYPTYSWQLLFRERRFMGLLNGINTEDSTRFKAVGENAAECLKTLPFGTRLLLKGDLVRTEDSPYSELAKVKGLIEKELSDRPHSTILYHLDSLNLSKYTDNEIFELYKSCDDAEPCTTEPCERQ